MSTLPRLYDVAFSLTSPDADFVSELVEAIRPAKSFFYLNEASTLTGASAVGPMRRAFRSDSKLNVIVHRPPWGQKGYTKLEQDAILGRYLEQDALPPFLIRMDMAYPLPEWYPEHVVWCKRDAFTVAEIAEQITAKLIPVPRGASPDSEHPAQWMGRTTILNLRIDAGEIARHVTARKAHLRQQELLKTSPGFDLAKAYMTDFVEQVDQYVKELRRLDPDVEYEYARCGPPPRWFVISSKSQAVLIKWERDGSPSVRDDRLVIEFYKDPISVPGGKQIAFYWHGQGREPRRVKTITYSPEITLAEQFVWNARGELFDYDDLARLVVIDFYKMNQPLVQR
jgi:hypothetical protein